MAWYRKQKVPTNLTSVATLDTNVKASGRKQGAAKRKRKPKDAVLQYEASLLLHSASLSSPQAFPSTFSCVNSPVRVPPGQGLPKVPIPVNEPLSPVPDPPGHPLPPVKTHSEIYSVTIQPLWTSCFIA